MNTLYVVGLGPGKEEYMTGAAIQALKESDIIVGYTRYVKQAQALIEDKEILTTGMHGEVERCEKAVMLSAENKKVALVSGGDAGVYGMAGLILEIVQQKNLFDQIHVEVIPGITSANACAAILGAPLMHDYVTISLSNWLTKLKTIEKRLHCAGEGDFAVVIYNPKSKARPDIINKAQEILLQYKKGDTPVGLVRNAYREKQEVELTTLEEMCECEINMNTTVVIGNSASYIYKDRLITPRGYQL